MFCCNTTVDHPANIYFFKFKNRNTKKRLKYVQSY